MNSEHGNTVAPGESTTVATTTSLTESTTNCNDTQQQNNRNSPLEQQQQQQQQLNEVFIIQFYLVTILFFVYGFPYIYDISLNFN